MILIPIKSLVLFISHAVHKHGSIIRLSDKLRHQNSHIHIRQRFYPFVIRLKMPRHKGQLFDKALFPHFVCGCSVGPANSGHELNKPDRSGHAVFGSRI